MRAETGASATPPEVSRHPRLRLALNEGRDRGLGNTRHATDSIYDGLRAQ